MPDKSKRRPTIAPSAAQGPTRSVMDLPAQAPDGLVHVLVDTPRGSSQKYKYDPQLRCFRLSRMLPAGMHFPCDFGSIPGTCAADGDALDVVLVSEHSSFVGCLVTACLIGTLEAAQREGRKTLRNDRLVGVPVTPVNPPRWHEIEELPATLLDELEQFFVSYNRAQGRTFEVLARRGAAAAHRALSAASGARRRNPT